MLITSKEKNNNALWNSTNVLKRVNKWFVAQWNWKHETKKQNLIH